MNEENDPTLTHGDGWTDAEVIEDVSAEEIQSDLKAIEEMRGDVVAPKVKGLRHAPSVNAAKKRKHKIALQKASRKANRGR